MYNLDSSLKTPLYIQLYEALKEDICTNYELEQKFISIRKLANLYNLSKTTVEKAYSQLVVEGYIDSFPKSGYIVLDNKKVNFNKEEKNKEKKEEKKEYLYDFYPARLEKNDFPIKTWKSLYLKAANEDLDLGAYSQGQGDYELRLQVSKYLKKSRAVNCNASSIIVSNCFSDCMSLLAKLLKTKNSSFAMEEPGYYIAAEVFKSFSYELEKVPLTKNGIDLDKLKKIKSKIVYLTPSHQYPTGVSIPIKNRLELLSWANENDVYLIEDDYDSELTYKTKPIPSLQGLDKNDRVIYIGTFSKSLSAALRVSYMVFPKQLFSLYERSYEFNTSKVCLLTQRTLARFMEGGYWDRHLRKIRTKNRKKHDLLNSLLKQYLNDTYEPISFGGGLSILIKANPKIDLKKLEKLAEEKNMKLYFAKEKSGGNFQGIRMGFGAFNEEELKKAIKIFSKLYSSLL